jgi:Zn-dependent protease
MAALSFRIGKIPVQVAPWFFVVAVVLGPDLDHLNPAKIAAWVVIMLGSVLIHELGHAVMGIFFGLDPRIQLHGMGGTTSWAKARPLSPGRRIAISLAGPAAGFALGGTAYLLRRALGDQVFPGEFGAFVFGALLWINVGWGVLNLLPMLPLDGGNVLTAALNVFTAGRGERPARIVSIVCAVAAVGLALKSQWLWTALIATSFIASNWRGLKDLAASEHDAPMRHGLELAYGALDKKDATRVIELARPIALGAQTPPVRAEALQLLAFGFLLEGRIADADAAIAAMPGGFAPHASLTQLRTERLASTASERSARPGTLDA